MKSLQVVARASSKHNMEFIRSVGKTVSQTLTGSGLEKPEFDPVKVNHEDYEKRHYPAAKWVSTDLMSMQYKEAGRQCFWKLFQYIQGSNEGKTKVEMTAPVTTKVIPGEGPNCENTFKMSFYVPPIHQDKPPVPVSPDVYISDVPARNVFVRSFGGFANDEKWTQEARTLAEMLDGRERVDTSHFYTVGYDSPFKMFNRRNEVWFEELPSDVTECQVKG